MANEIQIHGLEDVTRKMRALGPALAKKGARTAMRKAANIVAKQAKDGWRRVDREETPNSIADNVAVQFSAKTYKRTGDVQMRVGIRGGAKSYANTRENRGRSRVGKKYQTGGSTFYWRFYELGTSHQPARPIMVPALANNVEACTQTAASELVKQIDKLAAKVAI